MEICIGSKVRTKNGFEGTVVLLEGYPYRKAYVDLESGADNGYIYLTMLVGRDTELHALNVYDVKELEIL